MVTKQNASLQLQVVTPSVWVCLRVATSSWIICIMAAMLAHWCSLQYPQLTRAANRLPFFADLELCSCTLPEPTIVTQGHGIEFWPVEDPAGSAVPGSKAFLEASSVAPRAASFTLNSAPSMAPSDFAWLFGLGWYCLNLEGSIATRCESLNGRWSLKKVRMISLRRQMQSCGDMVCFGLTCKAVCIKASWWMPDCVEFSL